MNEKMSCNTKTLNEYTFYTDNNFANIICIK